MKTIISSLILLSGLTHQAHGWLLESFKQSMINSPAGYGAIVGAGIGAAVIHKNEWVTYKKPQNGSEISYGTREQVEDKNSRFYSSKKLFDGFDEGKDYDTLGNKKHYHQGATWFTRWFNFECPEKKCYRLGGSLVSFEMVINGVTLAGKGTVQPRGTVVYLFRPHELSQKAAMSAREKCLIMGACITIGATTGYVISKI